MKVLSNISWVYYVNEEAASKFKSDKVGKWMYFFVGKDFAETICKNAVEQHIVAEAKHSNASEGVCCFYLNCDDIAAHKRCITYFIENDLIRKTKTGKLYNISFKVDTQTRDGKYGSDFQPNIKLTDFVNLETSEWIEMEVPVSE